MEPRRAGTPSPSRFDAALAWFGDRRRGALALVAVVLVLFGPAVFHRATLDSAHFLGNDLRVREGRFGELWTKGYWNQDVDDAAQRAAVGDLYRPLTLTWMAAWYATAGPEERAELRPTWLNAANVGLHALSVVLRFWLFLLLLHGRPRGGAIAFFAALLLAVHPVATETVATQVGAAEGLATTLGTAAMLALWRWHDGGARRHAAWFAGFLLLALLAKENAVAIAAIAPAMALLAWRAPWRRVAAVTALSALPVGVWVALRLLVSGAAAAVHDPVLAGYPALARLQTALAAIGWYDVAALLWPFRLLAFVGHQTLWPPDGWLDPRVLVGLATVLAMAIGIAVTWRRRPLVAFALLYFAIAFFPVSNLVVPIGALAATRFLYLPMTGLALGAALGVAALLGAGGWRRGVGNAVAVALVGIGAIATVRELPAWRSDLDLQRAMFARAPDSMFASGIASALLADIAAAHAAKDAVRQSALQDEARTYFAAAWDAPRPRIPGTDAVPEDVLELAYKAGMSRGIAAITWGEDIDVAVGFATAIRDLARQAEAQSELVDGRTNWPHLESDAECMLAELAMQAMQRSGQDRAASIARAEQHIARARELAPANLRCDEQALRLATVRGDPDRLLAEYAAVYDRIRDRTGRLSAATRIALAYSQLLERRGEAERGLRIALETIVGGRDRFGDAAGFFGYGSRGIASRDPATAALARQALEVFLERADARDAANVATAKRLLGRR